MHQGVFDGSDVAATLAIGQTAARRLLQRLVAAGFVEQAPDLPGLWRPAMKGEALANARVGKPISRARADELLSGVIERARRHNSDERVTIVVRRIRVFGSYLDASKAWLGDLDLTVDIGVREQGMDPVEENRRMIWHLGITRTPRNFFESLFMASHHIDRLLKARKPAISLHPWGEPDRIGTRSVTVYDFASDGGPPRTGRRSDSGEER